jgi:hypothetical protein
MGMLVVGREAAGLYTPSRDGDTVGPPCYGRIVQRRMANAAALAVIGSWACLPSSARAYEDQFTLAVGAGYAHAIDDGPDAPGVAGDVSGSLGLGDAWAFRVRGGYSGHPGSPGASLFSAAGELLYVVDIVDLVPYAGIGAGVLVGEVGGDSSAGPSAHLVLGCDYVLSRSFALELDLRAAFLASDLPAPSYLTALVSGVFLFDR